MTIICVKCRLIKSFFQSTRFLLLLVRSVEVGLPARLAVHLRLSLGCVHPGDATPNDDYVSSLLHDRLKVQLPFIICIETLIRFVKTSLQRTLFTLKNCFKSKSDKCKHQISGFSLTKTNIFLLRIGKRTVPAWGWCSAGPCCPPPGSGALQELVEASQPPEQQVGLVPGARPVGRLRGGGGIDVR